MCRSKVSSSFSSTASSVSCQTSAFALTNVSKETTFHQTDSQVIFKGKTDYKTIDEENLNTLGIASPTRKLPDIKISPPSARREIYKTSLKKNILSTGFCSKRPFAVPKFPKKDRTSFDPQSTDHSVENSPRPRKRKAHHGTKEDPGSLDELIASLKRVAERDMKPGLYDKIKKKASNRNIPVESLLVEKLSLMNLSRRNAEEDDLESLGSVDTDMAPASETSRDLECTYSDLESINESISSRGDILSVTREEAPDFEIDIPEVFDIYNDKEFTKARTTLMLSGAVRATSTPIKVQKPCGEQTNTRNRPLELLPVEKLEAMIAELDLIISDTDSCEEQLNAGKLLEKPRIISMSKKSIEVPVDELLIRSPVTQARITKRVIPSVEHCKSSDVRFIETSTVSLPMTQSVDYVTLISRPTSEESLGGFTQEVLSNVQFQIPDYKFASKADLQSQVSKFLYL